MATDVVLYLDISPGKKGDDGRADGMDLTVDATLPEACRRASSPAPRTLGGLVVGSTREDVRGSDGRSGFPGLGISTAFHTAGSDTPPPPLYHGTRMGWQLQVCSRGWRRRASPCAQETWHMDFSYIRPSHCDMAMIFLQHSGNPFVPSAARGMGQGWGCLAFRFAVMRALLLACCCHRVRMYLLRV